MTTDADLGPNRLTGALNGIGPGRMKRDIQLSFDGTADKAIGALPLSVVTGSNADLIRTIAPLYLTGSVLDVTYGRGAWWTLYQPADFVAHDLELDGVDFRQLPEDDRSFDAVCFDPPYVPQSTGLKTGTVGRRYRDRYGLGKARTPQALNQMNAAGLIECARVTRQWLLVKCMDYADGGQLHLGHVFVMRIAGELGLEVHDLIVHSSGPSIGGGNIREVLRCKRAHSYLLVFRRTSRRPRPHARDEVEL